MKPTTYTINYQTTRNLALMSLSLLCHQTNTADTLHFIQSLTAIRLKQPHQLPLTKIYEDQQWDTICKQIKKTMTQLSTIHATFQVLWSITYSKQPFREKENIPHFLSTAIYHTVKTALIYYHSSLCQLKEQRELNFMFSGELHLWKGQKHIINSKWATNTYT